MAEQTTSNDTLEREAAADRLNDLASALRSGEDVRVRVGNKNVTLDPPEKINYRIEVIEKRKRFRGSRETIRLELDWKPE
jgi:amphi-Trp domain-containing protein